jgi:hypothetical protein
MTLAPTQAGALMTSENFDSWSFANFAPRYYSGATPINEAWLRRELALYSAENAAQVTAKVRRERTLKIAGDQLEGVYRTALESDAPEAAPAPFAAYLERMASEVDAMWVEREGMRGLRDHVAYLESKLAQPPAAIQPQSVVQPQSGMLRRFKSVTKSILLKLGA